MIRITFLFLIFCATHAGATVREAVTNFTLDNGLQVVVIQDHRAPVVTHMVWYRVGAADDPQGKSGIAHFFEHLMFNGTDDIPFGEFSKIIERNGGNDNAFTSLDYTGYFQRIVRDRLDLVMRMEADRMRDLILTGPAIERERQIVLEERGSRVDDSPGAIFAEQRAAALFLNHPYGRPVIGWRHEIEALTQADFEAFYRRHYAPNNAILVVAGDVYPDEVRELAETHFGPLAPTPDLPPRVRPQEPPHLSPRRVTYRDHRVSQPYLIRTYLAPSRRPGDQREAAALTVFASLLGRAVTGHLTQVLQYDEAISIDTGAYYSGLGLGPGTFGVYVVPAEDVSLDEAEARLDAALEAFFEDGPGEAELERIKTRIRAGEIFALDSQSGRARSYGAALTSGLELQDVETWPQVLKSVTKAEVIEAAREVLDMRRSVTGYLLGAEDTQ